MGSAALLQSLKESIVGQVGVKAIYGEPGSETHVWIRRRGRYARGRELEPAG
jgi:hypothetical protein